ncbi:MAG: MBL fold metallo-hydrolase [Anaerolineae bacterium]|nr:MBL fold metallo-hydrolase [Anaerolineae bacterium]
MLTHFNLGDYRCVLLNVGCFDMSAGVLFANAPADVLSIALAKHALKPELIVFQTNPLFVDTGVHRVVIEPGGTDETGRLSAALAEAGIDPATIDTVIITHGHADHYSGCIGADGHPAFPDASHFIQRAEWDHWLAPDNPEPHHAEAFRRMLLPLHDSFTLLDGDGEIVPGLEAICMAGHSPGHMVVKIAGQAVHVGDVLLNVVYIDHPDWYAAFDVWPDQVVESRRRLLGLLAEEDLLAVTYHFPQPRIGRVTVTDGGWQWVPEEPSRPAV